MPDSRMASCLPRLSRSRMSHLPLPPEHCPIVPNTRALTSAEYALMSP